MKRLWSIVFRIKMHACVVFTAIVIIALMVSLLIPAWNLNDTKLWFAALISIVAAILNWIFFGEEVFPKMSHWNRYLLFFPALLVCLTACAYFLNWFSMNQLIPWLFFIGAFCLILVIIRVVFTFYYRFTAKKYDEALNLFKQRKD